MHNWSRRAPVAIGAAAVALAFVGCGDASDQPATKSGGDSQNGKQEQQKKSSKPKENPYSGLARWEHQSKGFSAPDRVVFLDPKDGSPKAALELAFDEYLEVGTIDPDGRFVGMHDGALEMFQPNQKTGRYEHVRTAEVEQSYSDSEPRLQTLRFGPDGKRIYVEGHYGDGEPATFSAAFDKGPIEEETKLPESPPGFWPSGDGQPHAWHILSDGSVGVIESDTMRRQKDDEWISESWTTDSGEVYAAAALVPGQNGNDPEDGYFSYARLGENRFLAEYVKNSFEPADDFLGVLKVDPDSGVVDVTPVLEKPSGAYPEAILSPDGKRLVVSTSDGEMYIANIDQPDAEPRPLENLPEKEDDGVGESTLLGWL